MNSKPGFNIAFLVMAAALTLLSCSGPKQLENYEFMESVKDLDLADSLTDVYISSTMPIDSVDHNKLIFDIYRIDTTGYPENIKLYTRVYDSLGHFVTNMAEPNLKEPKINYWTRVDETLGRVRRKHRQIEKFTVREYGANDSIPYNLVLTVDYSGSMAAIMNVLFEGTEMFVKLKSKYDNIALSSFTRDFLLKVPLEKDTGKILNLYRTKYKEGVGQFSAVYDAAMKSVDLLKDTPGDVPRVLVIFTDGDDNYSQNDIDTLLKKANGNKVYIFTVAFGYAKSDMLKYLAQQTGGKYYKAYSKKDLVAIFRDIYMSLKYFYLVEYRPPYYWGLHSVAVSLNTPKRLDTLFARGQYETSGIRDYLLANNSNNSDLTNNDFLGGLDGDDNSNIDAFLASNDADNNSGNNGDMNNTGDGGNNDDINKLIADKGNKDNDGNKNTGDGGKLIADGGNKNTGDGGNKNTGDGGNKNTGDGGNKNTGDGGNKNTGDGGNKNTGDGGNKNTGDGGNKNTGDGGNKNTGDGGNKNTGDGGNKNTGDGGNKNTGDGGNKNTGDGGNKNTGDGGNKNTGDGGNKNTGDGGNKNTGDGGVPYGFDGNKFSMPILFDFDQAVIKPESYHIIEEIADELLAFPKVRIEVQGHTDSTGTDEFNQDLSERRAQVVMQELIKLGVKHWRLKYKGFGETVPVVPNDTEEHKARNRRTEFLIISK